MFRSYLKGRSWPTPAIGIAANHTSRMAALGGEADIEINVSGSFFQYCSYLN
jgi:hypothetical protein